VLPGAAQRAGVEFLMHAPFPVPSGHRDAQVEEQWNLVRDTTVAIRTVQAENQVRKGGVAHVLVPDAAVEAVLRANRALVGALARVDVVFSPAEGETFLAPLRFGEVRLPRPQASVEEIAAERARIESELVKLDKDLEGLESRLSDPRFAERAPEAVVAKARAQQSEAIERRSVLRERLASLPG